MTWRSSDAFVALTVSVAIFTDMFLYSVVVPVLPFCLNTRAGVPKEDVQFWTTTILTAYTFMFLVGSIVFGWIADRVSKRSFLLIFGLFLMLAATLLLALSRSLGLLIMSRMIQGLTAAIVWSAGLALLLDTFGHERFGRVMGYVVLCQNFGMAVAPVVGGVVFAKLGYDALLRICFLLVVVDISLRLLMVDNPKGAHRYRTKLTSQQPSLQPSNAVAATHETSPLLPSPPPLEPRSESLAASWYTFVILATYPRILAILICFCNVWAFQTAFDAVLPYKVASLFSWTSTGAGLAFLPVVVPAFLAPVSDILSNKWGPRKVAASMFLVGIPEFSCLAIIRTNNMANIVMLCIFLFLSGLVINLTISPLTSDLTYAISHLSSQSPSSFGENGAYGRAFGMLNCAFAVGGVIGPGSAGALSAKAGWTGLCLVMGAMNALCVLLVVLFIGGKPPASEERLEEGVLNEPI